VNVLIVEDERMAARRLERMTRDILGGSVAKITCLERIEESEQFLASNTIDVLLLDLNLNGEDGFELLKRATAGPFQTIIVSATTEQALRAFEYGVLDFVPKPVDKGRLERALARVSGEHTPQTPGTAPARYLTVKRLGALQLVAVDGVAFLKGAGDYVEIHLADGRTELHSKSLESLEKILPGRFVRVHKSYVVDVRRVAQVSVHGGGRYELVLTGGGSVPLSRTRYKQLNALLNSPDPRQADA
jgi:two-component system response regulator LytT